MKPKRAHPRPYRDMTDDVLFTSIRQTTRLRDESQSALALLLRERKLRRREPAKVTV